MPFRLRLALIYGACCAAATVHSSYRGTDAAVPAPRRPVAARATPFFQGDVSIDGVRVRYTDAGEGPPLLLVPGLTSRIEEFDGMIAALSPRFRVLTFDFPGSGYADKPDRAYDLEYYDRVLFGFLDEMDIGSCFIAGGSLGGNLALRAAHAEPGRVRAVVAWAPGSAWEADPIAEAAMRVVGGRTLFWPTVRAQSGYWYSEGWPGRDEALSDTFSYYREVMSPGFVRMYWDLAAEQVGWSLFDIAPEIRPPIMLVWGDRDDGMAMGDGVRRLHELIPGSVLVVIPGARHALSAERPDEIVSLMASFFLDPRTEAPEGADRR